MGLRSRDVRRTESKSLLTAAIESLVAQLNVMLRNSIMSALNELSESMIFRDSLSTTGYRNKLGKIGKSN